MTGRNEAGVLDDKVIVTKNIQVTFRTRQHDTQFYGATKALSLVFGAANHSFANSWTGEYDTASEKKYASVQETFFGNTLKCNELNEHLWIYNIVYFLRIPILRDYNTIRVKFIWVVEDNTVYLFNHMNPFTLEHMLLWQKDTNNYVKNDAESNKRPNELIIASSTDELNIKFYEKCLG